MVMYLKTIVGIGVATVALAGCNLGGSSDSGSGTLSLDVTDAPVDSAQNVTVVFNGVAIKPADGTKIEIAYDTPKEIDLLSLQGGDTASLLEGETLPAGEYEWIRLDLDGTSYIILDTGGQHDLMIPSGDQTGLKLVQGFTIPVNGSASFTIDFDLRKSVVEANGTYMLKPALRLVDNTEVGSISGTVDGTLISGDADCDDGGAVVYVFEGAGATPVDVQGAESDPIASALVSSDDFTYTAAFLVAGDYTVAFTCDGDLDDPTADDSAEVDFVGTQDVTVSAGTTTTADFQ